MTWTTKKPNSKTPPWILRQVSNRYHDDPIGVQSKQYSTELQNNLQKQLKKDENK